MFAKEVIQILENLKKEKYVLASVLIKRLHTAALLDKRKPNLRLISLLEHLVSVYKLELELSPISFTEQYSRILEEEYPRHFSNPLNYSNISTFKDYNIVEDARVEIVWSNGDVEIPNKISRDTLSKLNKKEFKCAFRDDNQLPVINIVTPSFNSEKYIDSTILSVVSQEGEFYIRYHIQDGGSSDTTLSKLAKWDELIKRHSDALIRCKGLTFTYSSKNDAGMYDAINKGFEYLNPEPGQYMSYINSDDVYCGGAISSATNIFTNNSDAHWIIGPVNGCDSTQIELSEIKVFYPRELIANGLCDHFHWNFIQQEGNFWKAELWNAVNGLSENLKYCGDWDLWRRFAEYTDPVHISWPLGRFRIHDEQLTSSINNYFDEIDSVMPLESRIRSFASIKDYINPIVRIVEHSPQKSELICQFKTIDKSNVVTISSEQAHLAEKFIGKSTKRPIRVLTLCTLTNGGAGTGTRRRVQALRKAGVDAKILSIDYDVSNPSYIGQIRPVLDAFQANDPGDYWRFVHGNNIEMFMGDPDFVGHDYFSSTRSIISASQLRDICAPYDIIHLHWVVGLIDYKGIADALKGKVVVWTTADMNSFTGGCHYSEGCQKYREECNNCALLVGKSNLPHFVWKEKKEAFEKLPVHLICPSNYIASLARKSSLLGAHGITVIPNAYPVDKFKPRDKIESRRKLELPFDKKLILFGAGDLDNYRKGGDLIYQLMQFIESSESGDEYGIVTFGKGSIQFPVEVIELGYLDEAKLNYAYSAADVFVSLSREDVGPMTVVESMLSGTLTVTFPVGVAPDFISHESTGYIAKPFDIKDVMKGINWCIDFSRSNPYIQSMCNEIATAYADPEIAARSHIELYKSLLDQKGLDLSVYDV